MNISLGLPSEHSFSKGECSLHISNPRPTRHFWYCRLCALFNVSILWKDKTKSYKKVQVSIVTSFFSYLTCLSVSLLAFIRARGADTAMWQPERRKRNKIVATVTWKQTNTRMQTTFFFQQYRATLAEEYFVHQFVLSSFFFLRLRSNYYLNTLQKADINC